MIMMLLEVVVGVELIKKTKSQQSLKHQKFVKKTAKVRCLKQLIFLNSKVDDNLIMKDYFD